MACPSGKYFNTLSSLCDQCPAACLGNLPPSDLTQSRCRELASECPLGSWATTASVTTTSSSIASATKTLLPSNMTEASTSVAQQLSTGALSASIIVPLVVFGVLLFVAYRYRRLWLPSGPTAHGPVQSAKNGTEESAPLNLAEPTARQPAEPGTKLLDSDGAAREASDTQDPALHSGKVLGAPVVLEPAQEHGQSIKT